MELLKLVGQKRSEGQKAGAIRREGSLPVVLYGNKQDNVLLTVKKNDLQRLYRQAGKNTIIQLAIEGMPEDNVLIYDLSYNPITDEIEHVDLLRVNMNEEITAEVPIEIVGESHAVKDLGGILVTSYHDLDVTCLPGDLPKSILLDISKLASFEDMIYVRDLQLGDKIKVNLEPDVVLATVNEPRSDAELAELDKEVEENVEAVESVKVKEEKAEGEEGEGGEATAKKEEGKGEEGKKEEKGGK
jgi:large subunit ribosomal protein L25